MSVGSLHAGSAFNIIAEQAELWGTIRTFDAAARQRVLRRVREVVEGTAHMLGASAQLEIEELTLAVVNDVAASARVQKQPRASWARNTSARSSAGWRPRICRISCVEVGGCFFFLGGARHSSEFPHHNPRFDFDEGVLSQGVAVLCETAASYLRKV